ncbi:MAG: DinB family protein, partial [Meiothermus silvanus]|nr:DinB family protein [Allomeiothermus silvanus]
RLDEVYKWTHPIRSWRMPVSQRWLLMHPITHEFHHKGQMMTLARIWGYTMPPETDTDLVPPTL